MRRLPRRLRLSRGGPAVPGRGVFPDELGEAPYLAEPADWTPSAADVEAAEELLGPALDASVVEGLDEVTAYYRQYAGVQGDALLVNAMCTVSDFDWQHDWIVVNDGGACFWQATITDGEVTDLSVNGYA